MSESTDDLERIRERKREELLEKQLGESSDRDAGAETPSKPIHVDGDTTLDSVVAEHPVVLVDFHAEWCGPCHVLSPIVDRIATDSPATVAKVDIDRNQRVAQSFNVRSVPTLILFVDGEPVERLVGVQDEGTLRQLIDQHR